MRNNIIFLFLFAWIIIPEVFPYEDNYHFRHYDNEDGLSYNSVFSILQDKNGFMWFGSKDGLNRFDGHQFKIYRKERNNPNSIISNYIQSLYEDENGLLWIGTTDGICSYNSKTDKFTAFENPNIPKGSVFNKIIGDSKGNIWFSNAWGIFRVSGKDGQLKDYFSHENAFFPASCCSTSSGEVWFISTSGDIYKYDTTTNQFKLAGSVYNPEIKGHISATDMADAGENGILIATENAGMKLFDPKTGITQTLFMKDHEQKDIYIRKITRIDTDEYWLSTQSGIHIYSLKKGFIGLIKKDPYFNDGLNDNAIYSVTKDTEGGIWVGTYFSGIFYLPKINSPFTRYTESIKKNSLKGSAIREITPDQNGTIWIGSENGGLNKLNPNTGEFENFQFASDNIHGLSVDGDKLWIGTFDQGIFIMDIPTEKIVRHYNANNEKSGLKINFVVTLLKTRENVHYIGTVNCLYTYNPIKDCMEELDFSQGAFIHHLMQDSKGTIWISTLTHGLIAKKTDGSISFFTRENDSVRINSLQVTSTFEDSNNQIWVTTRGDGIFIIDQVKQQVRNITTDNGLPNNVTYKALEDGNGNIWITSAGGLVCIHSKNGEMTTYNKYNGLTDNQFNYNSGCKDKSGRFYLGTINGMVSFLPEDFKENTFVAPIYITGFQVNNKELEVGVPDSPLKYAIFDTDKIVLTNNQSSFSIDFAALSYSAPEVNRYLYKLEGFDKEWNTLTSNRRIYYTNLPFGKYIFRIKSSTNPSKWDKQEKSLVIIIKPPFYLSTLALIAYIIGFILFIYIFYKVYHTRKIRKEDIHRQKMEDEKQKEIMRTKIDFFTNVAHEIRTPLTLIKSPLEKVIGTEEITNSVRENLLIMQKNTDRLLNLTNQLLDFRKIEANRLQLNFIKTDICDLLQATYLRFTPIAQQKHIQFNIHLPSETFEVAIDKEAVTKILSNLFNNAMKYAEERVDVFLEPEFSTKNFAIRVNNNGKRIAPEMREKIFELFFRDPTSGGSTVGSGIGLTLSRSLAELHSGMLYVDEKFNDTNSFVLVLPVMQDLFIDIPVEPKVSPASAKDQTDILPEHENPGKIKILIVDDETDLLNYLASELSDNYTVLKAGNGAEAMRLLEDEIISLIITDITMPVMDGMELCLQVKTTLKFSHIPILLLTTKTSLQSKIEGAESGADLYIDKPFDINYLKAQIQNLIQNRSRVKEAYIKLPLTHINSISQTKTDQIFLEKMNALILENISDPNFGVEKLAELMNLGISSLYRKVKGVSELTPVDFIKLIRLKKAAELLQKKEYKINEIAYMVGFSSPSYFTTSFMKQFGITPSQFMVKN